MGKSLAGRTILVTGASSGIGRATARLFASEGAKLAITARSTDKLANLAAELGPGTVAITADLRQPGDVDRMVDETLKGLGGLDAMIANAGTYITGDVGGQHPDAWDEMLMVNVNAVMRSVHRVLPHMRARKSGDIIVTSSIAGHTTIPAEPVYCASKHAINAFVYGLRRQVIADGIRVGAVAPGTVTNELWGVSDEAGIARAVAERTGIRSEDVADAILFMLTRPPHVVIRDIVILPQALDL